MGKAGRFACILVPMLCTLISLILIIILGLAGTNNGSMKGLSEFYLFKVDTRNFGEAPPPAEGDQDNVVDKAKDKLLDLSGFSNNNDKRSLERRALKIEDFYTTYLWSHCWGTVEDGDKWVTKDCTKPKFMKYEFDLQKIADDHSDTDTNIELPEAFTKIQKSSNWLFKFMGLFYALGALGTAITFIVGWFGLLSRWGSCVTLIFADASFLFIFGGSIMATIVAYGYKGAFNELSEDFGVTVAVGKKFIPITWVLTVFSLGAAFFWLFSTCCCSGRTRKVMQSDAKRSSALPLGRQPYTYERVDSPHQHGSVPMQTYGGPPAFGGREPMRQQQV